MINWIKKTIKQFIAAPTQPTRRVNSINQNTIQKNQYSNQTKKTKVMGTTAKNSDNLKVAKLIMVTANNNNKYYEMRENEDGSFTVKYGRVGSSGSTATYPISMWNSKYNQKVRKGYTDQTHLFAEEKKEVDFVDIDDTVVKQLISSLMKYANRSIDHNYVVKADQVTKLQVEEAQAILDKLVAKVKKGMHVKPFNANLLALYQLIPRRMTNVNDYLITNPKNEDGLKEIEQMLAQEQATLDVMRGQVDVNEKQKSASVAKEEINILQAMGMKVEQETDKKVIKMIKSMMKDHSNKFTRAYKVTNIKTQKAFDNFVTKKKNKKRELFWHGSRNENWLSIMKTGLVLRPANAVISGKMFGYGLYFADKFQKSLNYTSLRGSYWARGNQNKAFLALYDVHVGSQFKIKKHQSWCYDLSEKNLKAKGDYDSLYAQGGADLINNEYIVYRGEQCTVKYLIEVSA